MAVKKVALTAVEFASEDVRHEFGAIRMLDEYRLDCRMTNDKSHITSVAPSAILLSERPMLGIPLIGRDLHRR